MVLKVGIIGCGQIADAHAEAAEVLRIKPKFSVKDYAKHTVLKDEASKKLLVDDMREAGLPE